MCKWDIFIKELMGEVSIPVVLSGAPAADVRSRDCSCELSNGTGTPPRAVIGEVCSPLQRECQFVNFYIKVMQQGNIFWFQVI